MYWSEKRLDGPNCTNVCVCNCRTFYSLRFFSTLCLVSLAILPWILQGLTGVASAQRQQMVKDHGLGSPIRVADVYRNVPDLGDNSAAMGKGGTASVFPVVHRCAFPPCRLPPPRSPPCT